jgi:hypothetical protein
VWPGRHRVGNLGVGVDTIDYERADVDTDGYTAAVAGAETAQDACDRLNAAGHQATVQDESVVIDDGQATVSPHEGINKTKDQFYLWCIHDQDGELVRCVPRGSQGSCPPRN